MRGFRQRRLDTIYARKKNLEKKTYGINDVVRIKNNLYKNKTQFEKDIIACEVSTDKNAAKLIQYE